ncbi:MAG: Hsp20/alpha crystallin family protein [bacterium]
MTLMKYQKPSSFVNIFDTFFNDDFITNNNSYGSVKYDVIEGDDQYILDMSLPGFKKENVTINVDKDVLTINGERTKDEKSKYTYNGSFFGKFEKSFDLPDDVKSEDIKASFNDGILSISIPKNVEARVSKMIEIT